MSDLPVNVLFAWEPPEEVRSYIEHHLRMLGSTAAITYIPSKTALQHTDILAGTDILVAWIVTAELLDAAPNLKLVIIPAAGVDNQIGVLRARPDLRIVNSHGNTSHAAQHALALLMALTNRVSHFDRHMRDGRFRAFDDTPPSILLEGKTLGLLGTGHIARHFIRFASGLGLRFVACSRRGIPFMATSHSADAVQAASIPHFSPTPRSSLHAFLRELDILLITLPLTDVTRGLIDAEALEELRPESLLINIGRGPVVDEKALYEVLKSHRIEGAAIDVWYNYKPVEVDGRKYPYSLPFHELDNVVLSPHRGASPLQKPERFQDVVETIVKFERCEPLKNEVDPVSGY